MDGRRTNFLTHTHTHIHVCTQTRTKVSIVIVKDMDGRLTNFLCLPHLCPSFLTVPLVGFLLFLRVFVFFFLCDSNVLMSLVKDIDRHLADFGGNE